CDNATATAILPYLDEARVDLTWSGVAARLPCMHSESRVRVCAELSPERLDDGRDMRLWHGRIKRQRNGHVADPLGARKGTRFEREAVAKIREEVNRSVVDDGRDALLVEAGHDRVSLAVDDPDRKQMTGMLDFGQGLRPRDARGLGQQLVIAL